MFFVDVLRALAVVAGVFAVVWTLRSAIRFFVLPRGVSDPMARFVFLTTRVAFDIRSYKVETYEDRDAIMALFGPIALALLLITWLLLVLVGYMLVYWGLGVGSLALALRVSGSSLFTLGFATLNSTGEDLIIFTQAGVGLLLAALLIAYLPVIYGAWSRRERQVATLEVYAGSPPAAWTLITRYNRIQGLPATDELWPPWEEWFNDIEESHTSLSSAVFFRSPQPDQSWVNAAGVILDSAALFSSSVDVPRNPRRELCLRAGYICLRRIASVFRIPFDPDPASDAPISISRPEFDEVWTTLVEAGVPMKPDQDQAWRDFSGWRVNYDQVLLRLAALTMAPYAPWISDRSVRWQHPIVSFWRRRMRRDS